jgi:aquaporin Z
MKNYSIEFIGVFFLSLTFVLTGNNPTISLLAPLATGSMLAVMTYAGRHISGAHFNPAVTLAMLIRGKTAMQEAVIYVIVQVVAGVIAATVGVFLHSCSGEAAVQLHSNQDAIGAVMAEFLGAFALVFVFMHVSTSDSKPDNAYYGMAIGLTWMSATYALGGISGGVFNPALALGGLAAGMYAGGDMLIYLTGALVGAAAAATVVTVVYGRGD